MAGKRLGWSVLTVLLGSLVVPASPAQSTGPDVIVNRITDTAHYGPEGDIHAYAVGTESCNIGDEDLDWISFNNRHPVIAQNMFKLKDGRITQIGLSWLKHGFVTIDSGNCGTCPPDGTGNHLSPGCSDPYVASLNGNRSNLGPRWEVNAATGVFPYPYTDAPTFDQTTKRVRVHESDLDPNQNPGALYFVEGMYIAQDDAAAGNDNNNATYQRVTVSSQSNRLLTLRESPYSQIPAIQAWRDHGNGVNNADNDVNLTQIDVPEDGRFWVGAKASDLGGGNWHYEYAIQNLTSDRSGGSLVIAIPPGATVSNAGFHDVDYHSGEPWSTTDWDITITSNAIVFSSPEDYGTNPSSNALRWGTLYSFWFDVDAAPVTGELTLGLFKPGTPTEVSTMTVVPDASAFDQGDLNCDGTVDGADIDPFFLALGFPDDYANQYPGCAALNGDMNGDNTLDGADIDPFFDCLGFGNCP